MAAMASTSLLFNSSSPRTRILLVSFEHVQRQRCSMKTRAIKIKIQSSSVENKKNNITTTTTNAIEEEGEKQQHRRNRTNELVKLAAVTTLAAGVLILSFGDPDASAAKSGGRIGGQAFRPSSPPRSSSPRINKSRTNIYINPPVAPPLVGGYGYGYGVPFYGGWGWSPFSFFAPGPSVGVAVGGGGFQLIFLFMFLGAVTAVIRRLFGSRNQDEDDDYY